MSLTAELISVGTELLLGNILNTNAQFLSQALSGLGIDVYYQSTVGDNPRRLREAVELARSRADLIITTGGLGPTCDDLTKETLAAAFGLPLERHAESEARIRAYFAQNLPGRVMTDNNLQQAMLPRGCTVLANDWGTAPGCYFESQGCRVVMLPGPPSECEPMFTHRVIPLLQALSPDIILSRSLRIFGTGESAVEAMLRDKMNAMTNPTLAPYAKVGQVELRITAKAPDEAAARALIEPVEADLRALLGDLIYGADEDSLESVVFHALREKGLTFGCAESCTGGLVSKRMTDLPGVSSVFKGGLVTYWSQAKEDLLNVPHGLLEAHGAVSRPVACSMAQGAKKALGTDLAAAVTGVAGPDPDDRGNPVGLVYAALAAPDGLWCRELRLGPTRQRVRVLAAHHVFDLARRYLMGLPMNADRAE